jgi:heterotetrameric sarcosine oxidase gamma subunit
VFRPQSALSGVLKAEGRSGPVGGRQLRIGETRNWSLLQIAAFAGTLSSLEGAVRPVLGTTLPTQSGKVLSVEGRRVLKTGPEQYWIITRHGGDLLRSLHNAVTPDIGSIVSLSHSRTWIWIEGDAARETMAKGIALDFHPLIFEIDRFALTGLHHTPILVHRSGDNRYELFAMRTFSQSVMEWLIDAALPFGYEIAASG